MKARLTLLLLAASLLTSVEAHAAPRRLVLLFTGDNQGEIAPCGCKAEPQGGLARRKTAVEAERARGVPVVLLDAGNALFRKPLRQDDAVVQQRADLVLEQMEALGTAAMAVGARDLSHGLAYLQKATRGPKKQLKLLSANLVDKAGKAPFAASTVVEAGGLKVGVVGVSPEGAVAGEPALTGRAPLDAALAEARKLRQARKVDVVVVLAAVPYQEAMKLALLANDAVDFVVQSSENKGLGIGKRVGTHAAVFPAGELGRQLTRLELSVDGPGPSVDLGMGSRTRQQLQVVEGNLLKAHERLNATQDAQARADLSRTIVELEGRLRQLESEAEVKPAAGGRSHQLSYITLGEAVADDPALKQRVEKLEPPGSAMPVP
ncbi:bifunctional UDP-sugar hydrolase/5'-nucleotidase [Pyxidicoccus xibeiensis]|uniref:5'-nucleotidase n=1 Tax=Pyxidicoccus xibeiensis TaxID=2906759 RepID=UPI0020A819E1|nr:5'-nucleotidase [Pyxidicoccus xibeiensis]MCP3136731.1 5'-nucleotidase [Pyxidicoccus xibeiensis]